MPGNIGGLHWGGVAWDPARRLLIAPVNRSARDHPAAFRARSSTRPRKAYPDARNDRAEGRAILACRASSSCRLRAPVRGAALGRARRRGRGHGTIAWRVPLGDLREQFKSGIRRTTGSPNLGGPVTTDTGLVFIGATLDPHLRAFDTGDGREVWKARLPTSARATPMMFTTAGRTSDDRRSRRAGTTRRCRGSTPSSSRSHSSS